MEKQYRDHLLERFLRYVKIWTTSDRVLAAEQTPSTPQQWDLINLLKEELKDLGVANIDCDEQGYLIARLPASAGAEKAPCIGLMAHVDTADDSPGKDVKPLLHNPYDGDVIELPAGQKLDPAEFPELARYKGELIITSDGNTLLGADDKAGVAEIMTAVEYLVDHPEIPRGPLEIIFTPDEETGRGMDRFPTEKLKSVCCYTMDGGADGVLENECYYAHEAQITFSGISHHPGYARGEMVNANSMLVAFLNMIPRSESPEATDGRYGNYWPHAMSGSIEQADLTIYMRDFRKTEVERRLAALEAFAKATEAAFPGGKVKVETRLQYENMKERIDEEPRVMEYLDKAVRQTGIEPEYQVIRGGTDGSRLTAQGIPTPNVFTGGYNFHSRREWAALPAMVRASETIINLVQLWAKGSSSSE